MEEKLVHNMSEYLSLLVRDDEKVCELLEREHRSVQDAFTHLCLRWIETCASDNYRFDSRNEYSHLVSQRIVESVDF